MVGAAPLLLAFLARTLLMLGILLFLLDLLFDHLQLFLKQVLLRLSPAFEVAIVEVVLLERLLALALLLTYVIVHDSFLLPLGLVRGVQISGCRPCLLNILAQRPFNTLQGDHLAVNIVYFSVDLVQFLFNFIVQRAKLLL